MIETRKLPVKLTPIELERIVHEHSDVCSKLIDIENRKRAALSDFRHERKPHVERRDELELLKNTGVEERDVDCEIRESTVTGQMEAVRLDTGEVVDTWVPGASVDDDEPDPNQPVLPFAAPPKPELRVTAIDEDGVAYPITAEQADVIERLRTEAPNEPARVIIENMHRSIIAIRRGKACEFCGIVPDALGKGHRSDCEREEFENLTTPGVFGIGADGNRYPLHEEDAAIFAKHGKLSHAIDEEKVIEIVSIVDERELSPDTYDRNDSAAVAAHIDSMTKPNDAPLTPVGESFRPVTEATAKPKRKKAAAEGEASS